MVKDQSDSKGRKEMFYLTTQVTHFIYGYMEGRKEGNDLFNDALNTFYLRLYGRKEGNVLHNNALNTFYLRVYGRKEMFYLSNAFNTFYLRVYGRKEGNVLFNNTLNTFYLWYMEGSKEGNVLFNDALNTFYLRLYGVGHMVKNHTDSERGNPLPPYGLLLPISCKGSFICSIPDRIAHNTAFVKPVMEHWFQHDEPV